MTTAKAKKLAKGLARRATKEGLDLPEVSERVEMKETDAERFEGAASATITAKGPPKPQPRRSRRNLPVSESQRLGVYVPATLMTSVDERCFAERISVSEAVTRGLTLWVKSAAKG